MQKNEGWDTKECLLYAREEMRSQVCKPLTKSWYLNEAERAITSSEDVRKRG